MVQSGEYDKNTTIGYDKKQITRKVGDVWEDEHQQVREKRWFYSKNW